MTVIATGSFTNVASTPYYLPLSQQISRFDLVNLSKISSVTTGRIVRASWYPLYQSDNTATVEAITNFATTPAVNGVNVMSNLAQQGFALYDSSLPSVYAPVALASFTPGSPTVWTTGAAHGLQVGDNVRIYGLNPATQLSGLVQTVTAVGSTTTFTTLLHSTGATTSTGFVQKVGNAYVQNASLYFPQNRVIASITNANPMVVTTLVPQNYAVGDVVTFQIPSQFSIPGLSPTNGGLPFTATITAVNNAVGTQSVTFGGVNSNGFGTFGGSNGWPAQSAYPFSPPIMVPYSEGNINNIVGVTPAPLPYANQDVLSFAKQNTGSRGILIGSGDGTAAASTGGIIGTTVDTWAWTCYTAAQSFPQLPSFM